MAGNQPASPNTENTSPRPDCGPPGNPQRFDPAPGYAEPQPTKSGVRDAPDPTVEGNRSAQVGSTPPAQDPDSPDINEPVPPGDIPSKTPVKEPERDEAQYVGGDATNDPQAMYSDAATPGVPGSADGAD